MVLICSDYFKLLTVYYSRCKASVVPSAAVGC